MTKKRPTLKKKFLYSWEGICSFSLHQRLHFKPLLLEESKKNSFSHTAKACTKRRGIFQSLGWKRVGKERMKFPLCIFTAPQKQVFRKVMQVADIYLLNDSKCDYNKKWFFSISLNCLKINCLNHYFLLGYNSLLCWILSIIDHKIAIFL